MNSIRHRESADTVLSSAVRIRVSGTAQACADFCCVQRIFMHSCGSAFLCAWANERQKIMEKDMIGLNGKYNPATATR